MTHTKSKAIRNAWEQYKKSTATELWHVYGRFSDAKKRAMDYCEERAYCYLGLGTGRIIAHNAQVFSYGFVGSIGGKRAFFYITRDYDRYILLDELNRGV